MNLSQFGENVTSQFGEDGVIYEVIRTIGEVSLNTASSLVLGMVSI